MSNDAAFVEPVNPIHAGGQEAYARGRASIEMKTREPNPHPLNSVLGRYFDDGVYDATVAREDSIRRAGIYG